MAAIQLNLRKLFSERDVLTNQLVRIMLRQLTPKLQSASFASAIEKKKVVHSTKTIGFRDPIFFESHLAAVKSIAIFGCFAFTGSEDGAVHIYDLETSLLVKKIESQGTSVNWLHVVSSFAKSENDLTNLTLFTGSDDGNIRKFSLESDSVVIQKACSYSLTCCAANKDNPNLFVGTRNGLVISYNPSKNSIRKTKIKVSLII